MCHYCRGAASFNNPLNQTNLTTAWIVDPYLCYSDGFQDPYGHTLELNCYEYEEVKRD